MTHQTDSRKKATCVAHREQLSLLHLRWRFSVYASLHSRQSNPNSDLYVAAGDTIQLPECTESRVCHSQPTQAVSNECRQSKVRAVAQAKREYRPPVPEVERIDFQQRNYMNPDDDWFGRQYNDGILLQQTYSFPGVLAYGNFLHGSPHPD